MSFTPINKLTADRALDQIAVDATEFFFRMDRSVEQITAAAASLAGMTTSWSAAVAFIDAEEAAAPGDKEWQALKERKDSLVIDFLAMRNKVQAVRDAAIAAQNA